MNKLFQLLDYFMCLYVVTSTNTVTYMYYALYAVTYLGYIYTYITYIYITYMCTVTSAHHLLVLTLNRLSQTSIQRAKKPRTLRRASRPSCASAGSGCHPPMGSSAVSDRDQRNAVLDVLPGTLKRSAQLIVSPDFSL